MLSNIIHSHDKKDSHEHDTIEHDSVHNFMIKAQDPGFSGPLDAIASAEYPNSSNSDLLSYLQMYPGESYEIRFSVERTYIINSALLI